MSDKCEHESTIVTAEYGNVSIQRCTWDCGEVLVSVKLDMTGNTFTVTTAELRTLRASLARLERIEQAARLFVYTRAPGSSVTQFPAFQRLKDAVDAAALEGRTK